MAVHFAGAITMGNHCNSHPRVSIGLPVYNGGRFIADALDSLLRQTYSDFELIISDNASTDDTQDICSAYANKDRRIRYYRNGWNLGAAWNFNRLVELSRGEYFKWAAHDDVCGPDFLLRCVKVLDRDSSVVLCYPKAVDIDERSVFLRDNNYKLDTGSTCTHRRFGDLISINHSCLPIFGVIRTSVLLRTSLIGSYVASDRVLLGQLALAGRFHEVPETLLFHREHQLRSTKAMPKLHSRTGWFDPIRAGRIVFPTWRLLGEYVLSVGRAELSLSERIMCNLQTLPWLCRNWKQLLGDLAFAALQAGKSRKSAGENCPGQVESRKVHSSVTATSDSQGKLETVNVR